MGVFHGKFRKEVNGVHSEGEMFVNIRCGRWDCPICGKKKARKVYRRAMEGKIMQDARKAGFRDKYNHKLLTLTYGGSQKREGKTPAEATREMTEAFSKLVKELRYLYGNFEYIRVFENHKDGWPHLHVMLAGSAIAPRQVLGTITRLWRYRYQLGYVKLNWVDSPERALKYVLKYLFKNPEVPPRTRLFTNSREALEAMRKNSSYWWESTDILWEASIKFLLGKEGDVWVEEEVFPMRDVPF